ncbi:MAG: hypothetical protein ROW39_10025, partial [Anaerolineaceae bacterium]
MKRTAISFLFILTLVLLAGCLPRPDVAESDADMATRVAAILTEMAVEAGVTPPAATPEEPEVAAPEQVEPTQAATETPEATATEVILPPTETPLPSPTAT